MLDMYKAVDIVLLCKTRNRMFFMFVHPALKVVRHTYIHALAIPVRQDINIVIMLAGWSHA